MEFLQRWADAHASAVDAPMLALRGLLPALSPDDWVPATCLVIHAWEEPIGEVLEALRGDERLRHEGLYMFCLQEPAMRTVEAAASAMAHLSKASPCSGDALVRAGQAAGTGVVHV